MAFISMLTGTADDHQAISRAYRAHKEQELAPTVLGLLRGLAGPKLGYPVDRFEHSLQSASRALRDGADEETIVCALLHDIGDLIAPDNHAQAAAAILRPYVSDRNYWIVLHHTIFQGYYYFEKIGKDPNVREAYRGNPWFDDCDHFCRAWDECAFDPGYDTLPIERFEPMVRSVFARKPVFDYRPRTDLA